MVPDIIREAVMLWAQAPTIADAAEILRRLAVRLDRNVLLHLRRVVAEISMQMAVNLLTQHEGERATVRHAGMSLTRHQIDRLNAWLHDQATTARALQVNEDEWKALLTEVAPRTHTNGNVKVLLDRILSNPEDAIPVEWQTQMDSEWRQVQINMGPAGAGSFNRQHLAMGRFSMNANPHQTAPSTLLPS